MVKKVNKTQVKAAGRKVKQTKRPTVKKFWARVWDNICAAARWVRNLFRRFWNWLAGINLVALLNLALLVAIIVLFSLLVLDIAGQSKKQAVVIIAPRPVPVEMVPATRNVSKRPVMLPIKQNIETRQLERVANVVPVKPAPVAVNQVARTSEKMMGDIVIDSRGAAQVLQNGSKIQGNLYLQNMRKYTLPCGIKIEGNLFLRNLGLLQFCGPFTVTGNIYVSPSSTFGPIPRTARIGGHVVF